MNSVNYSERLLYYEYDSFPSMIAMKASEVSEREGSRDPLDGLGFSMLFCIFIWWFGVRFGEGFVTWERIFFLVWFF